MLNKNKNVENTATVSAGTGIMVWTVAALAEKTRKELLKILEEVQSGLSSDNEKATKQELVTLILKCQADTAAGTENSAQGELDEKALSGKTREQLTGILNNLGFNPTKEATKEDMIKAILDAQKPDENVDLSRPVEDSASAGTEENGKQKPDNNTPPSKEGNSVLIAVSSKERKGKTIIAISGQPIVFDENGIAEVNEADALYLKQIPGFEFS